MSGDGAAADDRRRGVGLIASGRRPPSQGAGALRASLWFAWRSLLKIKHVPEQLADVTGIPILFTLMFTYLFGGAVAGSTHQYLQFLLPGTVALAVVFVTVYSGVTLNRDLATGAFDRYRSMPIWRGAPIVGGLIGDAGRYLLSCSLVIGLGLIMGFDVGGGALGVIAGVALVLAFAASLSWAWLALGLVLRSPNAVMSLAFVILFPLVFMSNIFVDPATMPSWLEAFAEINPMSHLATAERALFRGNPVGDEILWVLVAAAALTALFAPLTMWLFDRRG
jgi:ABC-2 type transport system permease protein